jgi:hypothetical protein
LKLKFIKAFFYSEVTVASPSCSLYSWTCSSLLCTVCTSWQSNVQSLLHWIEYMTLIPRHYIFQNCHKTTLTHSLTGSLNSCTLVDVVCRPEKDLQCVIFKCFFDYVDILHHIFSTVQEWVTLTVTVFNLYWVKRDLAN